MTTLSINLFHRRPRISVPPKPNIHGRLAVTWESNSKDNTALTCRVHSGSMDNFTPRTTCDLEPFAIHSSPTSGSSLPQDFICLWIQTHLKIQQFFLFPCKNGIANVPWTNCGSMETCELLTLCPFLQILSHLWIYSEQYSCLGMRSDPGILDPPRSSECGPAGLFFCSCFPQKECDHAGSDLFLLFSRKNVITPALTRFCSFFSQKECGPVDSDQFLLLNFCGHASGTVRQTAKAQNIVKRPL